MDGEGTGILYGYIYESKTDNSYAGVVSELYTLLPINEGLDGG